jgi:hypothetical protein
MARGEKMKGIEKSRILDGRHARLSSNGDGTLKLRHQGHTWPHVRAILLKPLTEPEGHATVQDLKGKEVGLLRNLGLMDPASRAALDEAKRLHYLTSPVLKIHDIAYRFGAVFWDVETGRGRREFVIQGTTEHVRWLSDTRLLITDVDGNRFEIVDRSLLDKKSRGMLDLVL